MYSNSYLRTRLGEQSLEYMPISAFTDEDLSRVGHIQPSDWPDIRPHLQVYLNDPFCFPVKSTQGNIITGIGTSYIHEDSAWLAHIIVGPDFRGQGIGGEIVGHIVQDLDIRGILTSYLEATALGYPVYIKHGFEPIGHYQHFTRTLPLSPTPSRGVALRPAGPSNFAAMLELDRQATGEGRQRTLTPFLPTGIIAEKEGQLGGFYLPDLENGPIIASNPDCGLLLMHHRAKEQEQISLNVENRAAMRWAKTQGLTPIREGIRMRRGNPRSWHPDMLFNRTSGALG